MSHVRDLIRRMSDNVDEAPAWQEAMRRAYLGYLQLRYRDPIQRQAQAHLHDDLTFVEARTSSFASAPKAVQRQVIRELEHQIEVRKSGNASPPFQDSSPFSGRPSR